SAPTREVTCRRQFTGAHRDAVSHYDYPPRVLCKQDPQNALSPLLERAFFCLYFRAEIDRETSGSQPQQLLFGAVHRLAQGVKLGRRAGQVFQVGELLELDTNGHDTACAQVAAAALEAMSSLAQRNDIAVRQRLLNGTDAITCVPPP